MKQTLGNKGNQLPLKDLHHKNIRQTCKFKKYSMMDVMNKYTNGVIDGKTSH